MINKELEKIISKYKIKDPENIIYGTNIPMPNLVIPTPYKTFISFEKSEYYFFLFNDKGITVYPLKQDNYAFISWKDVTYFKVSHIFILGKLTIKTKDGTYKFQLNRFVIGSPWIRKNTKNLERDNYHYVK